MTKKNVVTINLRLTQFGLQKFKNVPTFKNTLWPNQIESLTTGDNVLRVNNYIYGTLKRIVGYDSENMSVEKID